MSDVAAIQVRRLDVDIETVRVLDVDGQIEMLDVSAVNVALHGVSKRSQWTITTNGSRRRNPKHQ
jgi:hypothetical protein